MNKSYEEAFAELEVIVNKLQDESTNIDEAIELFKAGIELQKHCQKILDDAQNKVVTILNEENEEEEYSHE